ncbi:MAG TPA: tannase/feruloyl esterase family alpha/beta hydrolase [Pyrinomonadaceae bacterium]|nr:tannase/feruloyl esterase family alpha/beta hydrolase [Pyrinomonadaceae bacterium]
MSYHAVLSLTPFVIILLTVAGLRPSPTTKARAGVFTCTELTQVTIPNVKISLAQVNPATTNPLAPAHCEVVGKINERIGVDGKPYAIGFHLRLPIDWNGRFFFQGGGGLDGNLGNALGTLGNGQSDNAISRGYSVVSTDAGHQPEPVAGIGGALFGLDPQARIDYGYNAIDVVTNVAKQIVELHYGKGPHYSYFVGCSNGGRQGMVASQRFPNHFDGIAAGDPGFNLPEAAVAGAWDSQALALAATQFDVNGQPYLPTSFSFADLTLVANSVLTRCDALDGLTDGIVENFAACNFNPVELQCPGIKTPMCLTVQQVTALNKVFNGARNSHGDLLYATWPFDTGIGTFGWRKWKIGAPTPPPLINNAINLTLGASALPYVFVAPPDTPQSGQLVSYIFQFDFDTDAPRIFQTSGIYTPSPMEFMSANHTDLREFRRYNNKLLIYHGVSDPVFSVNDTINWYNRVQTDTPGLVDEFARLFLIPGMNHCGGGPATDQFDALTPLVEWVEHGKKPDQIIGTANAGSPWPERTRPLCSYPNQARYKGSGDINDAANFICERPDAR